MSCQDDDSDNAPPRNPNSDDEPEPPLTEQDSQSAEDHLYALARFYIDEAGLPRLVKVATNLIHSFNWLDPFKDYLVPRQDARGLISYQPALVLKTGRTRKELEFDKDEPINKEKRVPFSKKRCSALFDQLIKRDGPIGNPDCAEAECEDEDGNLIKGENSKIQKYPAKKSQPKSKKVPSVKEIDPVDLQILEYQAREMPGLQLNADDDETIQNLKMELVKSQLENAELKAQMLKQEQDRKISNEMIERLAERLAQVEKNQQAEPVRRRLTMDVTEDRSLNTDSGFQEPPPLADCESTAARDTFEPQAGSSASFSSRPSGKSKHENSSRSKTEREEKSKRSHKKKSKRAKKKSRKMKKEKRSPPGQFSAKDYIKFEKNTNMEPFQQWWDKDPETGDKVLMIHLLFGVSIPWEIWITFKGKDPSKFARELLKAIHSDEKLANRAVDMARVTTHLDFDTPRKTLTPEKWACVKVLYEAQVDKKIGPGSKRERAKKKLNEIIGSVINNALQYMKAQRESDSSSSSSSSSGCSSDSSSKSSEPLARPLPGNLNYHQKLVKSAVPERMRVGQYSHKTTSCQSTPVLPPGDKSKSRKRTRPESPNFHSSQRRRGNSFASSNFNDRIPSRLDTTVNNRTNSEVTRLSPSAGDGHTAELQSRPPISHSPILKLRRSESSSTSPETCHPLGNVPNPESQPSNTSRSPQQSDQRVSISRLRPTSRSPVLSCRKNKSRSRLTSTKESSDKESRSQRPLDTSQRRLVLEHNAPNPATREAAQASPPRSNRQVPHSKSQSPGCDLINRSLSHDQSEHSVSKSRQGNVSRSPILSRKKNRVQARVSSSSDISENGSRSRWPLVTGKHELLAKREIHNTASRGTSQASTPRSDRRVRDSQSKMPHCDPKNSLRLQNKLVQAVANSRKRAMTQSPTLPYEKNKSRSPSKPSSDSSDDDSLSRTDGKRPKKSGPFANLKGCFSSSSE